MESCEEFLKRYFLVPYGGHVFAYSNKITLEDVKSRSFTELLSHENAPNGHSVAMEIFDAITNFENGLNGKSVLDVGGGNGYFSFLSAEAGATALMVERLELLSRVAKCISIIKHFPIVVFNGLIQDYLSGFQDSFDCAFLLNVFDQMLRSNEQQAWATLNQIQHRAKHVFMMTGPCEHLPNTPGIRTGYPISVPLEPIMDSEELGYDMVLRKGGFKEHHVLLRDSFCERELWVFS